MFFQVSVPSVLVPERVNVPFGVVKAKRVSSNVLVLNIFFYDFLELFK